MPHDPRKYLVDIQDRAKDRQTRSAVERELMVLGEAFFQLHERFPEIAEQFDAWKEIVRFRHVMVHGYDSVNVRTLWEVIQNDLDPLLDRVRELLGEGIE